MSRLLRPCLSLLALLVCGSCLLAVEALPAQTQEVRAREIYRIFERSCIECHGPQLPKPKSGFGRVLDLAALSLDPDYVVPGRPEESELVLCLTGQGFTEVMPPSESEAPPLQPDEIALIVAWVRDGAGTGGLSQSELAAPNAQVVEPARSSESEVPRPASEVPTGGFTFKRLIAALHPFLVHVPIALLLVAACAEIFHMAGVRSFLPALRFNCWFAVVGGVPAVISGLFAANVGGYATASIVLHRMLGFVSLGLAIACLVLVELLERQEHRQRRWLLRLLLLAAVLVVCASGYTGGELVHGRGHLFR